MESTSPVGEMTFDYDKLYGETPDALGQPTAVFVEFFDKYASVPARVLDVGCGQGRDALFIARLGHSVVGVDISSNGIRDLNAAARKEGLSVEGVVANIADYDPDGLFDVVLIDRTLHMLPLDARLSVLSSLLDHVAAKGWVLIADERSNIADFQKVVGDHKKRWKTELLSRGYLFVRRD